MPYTRKDIRPEAVSALADVAHAPYWLDRPVRPAAHPALTAKTQADLAIVGGGYTGLWTAILAKQQDPNRDVLLLEADRIAEGASGRNGGFMAASITHGFANGHSRWPAELPTLLRLGRENLAGIIDTISSHDLQVDLARTGELDVATEDHQVPDLQALPEQAAEYGEVLEFLDAEATRALVHSPLYRGGVLDRSSVALVDPAKLAWELARLAADLGVRIHERTAVTGLARSGTGVQLTTTLGSVQARQVALGTSAFPPLLRRIRAYVVPVYDYVLVTEPLTPAQWDAVGWQFGGGVGDVGNQFHYSRPTVDGRILWGGFDAIYHFGNGMGPQYNRDDRSFALLAEHFLATFPQLTGIRFTHAWGGAIDTCSRFSAFWGTALGGRVSYSLGYTGLGVGATRFGAAVMLDLLAGRSSARTGLQMVGRKPVPFPPEPARSAAINLTRWSLDRADSNSGRRNPWLRTLDALHLGFDS